MVTPNVTFPYRIPKAELDYVYDGPELYYCDAVNGGMPTANSAMLRQDVQGLLRGYDVIGWNADSQLMGFLDLEYICDFFEPIAPLSLLGASLDERSALRALRRHFQKPVTPLLAIENGRLEDDAALRRILDQKVTTDSTEQDAPAIGVSHACPGKSCNCMRKT
jgi:hypothetical protein